MQDYREFLDEILVDTESLQKRVCELGAQISHDYQGMDLHLICILRGGVVFMTDLMRFITVPHTLDFMAVSSYGTSRQTTGQVRITYDLKDEINDRNVLLVEDIVDSGYTIASVLDMLRTRHPQSLRVCTMLNKPERREVTFRLIIVVLSSQTNSSLDMVLTWTNTIATSPSSLPSTWRKYHPSPG